MRKQQGGAPMKFGIFYEHQLPRPWNEGDEHRLFQEALDQVELADRLGIDYAWEVEHHFLEEYSHSSAPEIFLAACSQRTRNIRLGHGICLMPPKYNHPARVAERIATLDLVSNGRVEFGTGESASLMELGGFNVGFDPVEKRRMWHEGVEQCTNMMVMDPYPGFKGEFFEMPCRNVVPKPVQNPPPPLWVACSNRETIKMAARYGIGALTFAFVDPREARQWVDDYYRIFKEECVPIGHAVNPNVAMVTGFSVHPDEMESRRRGEDGLRFFRYGLAHHYIFGEHKPGRTDIWANFEKARHALPAAGADHGIGTPDQLRTHLRHFEESGVDQTVFIQQGGRNQHRDICEALELFAKDVMPEFRAREMMREKQKLDELAPYIKKAMERKRAMKPMRDEDIPVYVALGRKVAEEGTGTERQKQNARLWADAARKNLKSVAGRGRKVVELDLKDKAAITQVLNLLANADALIEGFRPGVMERLGLGPEMVQARNPRLVYGRMTGWGQQGPLAQAAASIISRSPARLPRSDLRPDRCHRSIWSAISAAARCIWWSACSPPCWRHKSPARDRWWTPRCATARHR